MPQPASNEDVHAGSQGIIAAVQALGVLLTDALTLSAAVKPAATMLAAKTASDHVELVTAVEDVSVTGNSGVLPKAFSRDS